MPPPIPYLTEIIPAEIRQEILKHLLKHDQALFFEDGQTNQVVFPAILSTCKLLHNEGHDILYNNLFKCVAEPVQGATHDTYKTVFIRRRYRVTDDAQFTTLSLIRRLQVVITPLMLPGITPAPRDTIRRLVKMLNRNKNITDIAIHFKAPDRRQETTASRYARVLAPLALLSTNTHGRKITVEIRKMHRLVYIPTESSHFTVATRQQTWARLVDYFRRLSPKDSVDEGLEDNIMLSVHPAHDAKDTGEYTGEPTINRNFLEAVGEYVLWQQRSMFLVGPVEWRVQAILDALQISSE